MAAEAAGEETASAAEATAGPLRPEDLAEIVQHAVAAQLSVLREDRDTLHRDLDAIRSTLQTAILGDVMALLARSDAPEESDLQRRARLIELELTLRRQEIALEEWRRRVAAAEQEMERRRSLFARLEVEFERHSTEFDRQMQAARGTEQSLRATLAQCETESAATRAERDAVLAQKIAIEHQAGDLARDYGAAQDLSEARRRLAETLEQDLARVRQDYAEEQGRREAALTEAQRRVEELRNSRWRQIGLGLGLAKRATFEK